MEKTPDLQDILIRLERIESIQAHSTVSMAVESLVLRDRDGTPRALLSVEEGSPRLRFADASMRSRVVLGIDDGGAPFLDFADEKGVSRARLSTHSDGSPGLRLFGSDGTTAAGLVVLADGSRRMALFGPNGNPSVTLSQDDDGRLGLTLYDEQGTSRAEIGLSSDGAVRLRLADEDGKCLFQSPEPAPPARAERFEYAGDASAAPPAPVRSAHS